MSDISNFFFQKFDTENNTIVLIQTRLVIHQTYINKLQSNHALCLLN